MDNPSKDKNSIEDLNSKLNEFLSDDFEICPDKPIHPETDIESKELYSGSKCSANAKDLVDLENESTVLASTNAQPPTEAKFKKMKIDNELASLKKRIKEPNGQSTQQQDRPEADPINDDEFSNSLKSFLGKLNNSK